MVALLKLRQIALKHSNDMLALLYRVCKIAWFRLALSHEREYTHRVNGGSIVLSELPPSRRRRSSDGNARVFTSYGTEIFFTSTPSSVKFR